jgi:hypothetical protein
MAKNKTTNTGRQSVFELDIIKKLERTNVSVEELRTGVWAPIEKISSTSLIYKNFIVNKRTRSIVTSWGKVSVSGNILTQTHRDLLDCILAVSTQTKELESGDVAVYFQKSDALRKYGDKAKKNNKWIDEKLKEIQNSSIELRDKKGNFYRFNILKLTAYSEIEEKFGIVFTSEYRKYIEGQLTIGYLSELDKLLTVESAVLKAIIRFFWTHKDAWRMDIDDLLATVGYPIDSVKATATVKRDIEANLDKLEQFGIYSSLEEITNNGRRKVKRLLYHKPEDTKINFISASNTTPTLS